MRKAAGGRTLLCLVRALDDELMSIVLTSALDMDAEATFELGIEVAGGLG